MVESLTRRTFDLDRLERGYADGGQTVLLLVEYNLFFTPRIAITYKGIDNEAQLPSFDSIKGNSTVSRQFGFNKAKLVRIQKIGNTTCNLYEVRNKTYPHWLDVNKLHSMNEKEAGLVGEMIGQYFTTTERVVFLVLVTTALVLIIYAAWSTKRTCPSLRNQLELIETSGN